jgi:hypothetical protein
MPWKWVGSPCSELSVLLVNNATELLKSAHIFCMTTMKDFRKYALHKKYAIYTGYRNY